MNNFEFKPPLSGENDSSADSGGDSNAAPDKNLIYNEAQNFSRQLTFKRETEEEARFGRKQAKKGKNESRGAKRDMKKAKKNGPRKSQQGEMMANSSYLKTPPQTMKKNKSSYLEASDRKRKSESRSPYQSENRHEKVSNLKNITEEFIHRSRKNIFFQEDGSDSKHKPKPPNQPTNASPFKPAPSSEYNTNPSQANTLKMGESGRRSKRRINRTENQFYANTNQRNEPKRLKKNSSATNLANLHPVPKVGNERLTVPSQTNPLANLYVPRESHHSEAVSGQGQFVFVSKKDAQVYQLRNIRDEHGQSKKVLVNVRDKSVKGLKSISSVKSITSIKDVARARKAVKPRGKKKKKKRRRPPSNQKNVSSSMYNNYVPEKLSNSKQRKKSFNLGRSGDVLILPKKFTKPQQILPSNSELDDRVISRK